VSKPGEASIAAWIALVNWPGCRSSPIVQSSLGGLIREFDQVVIEGAGSPAEINLRASDIVNMSVALECRADVYLVADIDRGGAFAHLLGTWQFLEPAARALIRGFVLNKFRGDPFPPHAAATRWLSASGSESVRCQTTRVD
jgi:cobyric acid synthase